MIGHVKNKSYLIYILKDTQSLLLQLEDQYGSEVLAELEFVPHRKRTQLPL
jgi:hypothetical protein